MLVIELPGFGSPRVGGVLYLLGAIPIGIVSAVRADSLLAIQLVSPSLVAAVTSAVTRTPWLASSTSSGELSELPDSIGRWPVALRRRALRTASKLLGQTEVAAEELRRALPGVDVAVLPNPVELVEPVPGLDGRPRVVFSGRLSVEKDLGRLLDAWVEVLAEVPDAVLTIAGEGGGFRSVEAEVTDRIAASEPLAASVALPGWVDDVASIVRESDVWVLPSWSEGMSNALLEACALGRVVVASDIAANRAVLGDEYPLLHEARNTGSLRDALLVALRDDSTRERARAATVDAANRHGVDVIVDRLSDLLRDARRPRRQHP